MVAAEVGVPLWVALLGSATSFVLGLLMWWVKRIEVDSTADDRDRDRELEEIKEALKAWRAMVKEQAEHLTSVAGRLDDAMAKHRNCEGDLIRMRAALAKMGVPVDDLMPMRRNDDITNRGEPT